MKTSDAAETIANALGWSAEISCCPDKERYALRIWDLFDELNIKDIPEPVMGALRDLIAWEACEGPCNIVEDYLVQLLDAVRDK